jgi:hypothetical protein
MDLSGGKKRKHKSLSDSNFNVLADAMKERNKIMSKALLSNGENESQSIRGVVAELNAIESEIKEIEDAIKRRDDGEETIINEAHYKRLKTVHGKLQRTFDSLVA